MKMRFPLIAALALAVTIAACNDMPVAPDVNFELVDLNERVAEDQVNARVWLSFAIPFEVEVPGGGTGVLVPVAQQDGPALNFPGNQKNAGTCESGTWKNKNGKGIGGTNSDPHPHCTVYEEQGGTSTETVEVILEPISARYERVGGSPQWRLRFTNETGDNGAVKILANDDILQGSGEIVAWAVLKDDANNRVGKITFDLGQFDGEWDTSIDCEVSGDPDADGCLRQEVAFSYTPEADGIGAAGEYTGGFFWWESVGSGWTRED
jgi:hypothetical protein